MSEKKKIGWIGLGKMGVPMTLNLVGAGFPLTVYNRTAGKTGGLKEAGAEVAGSVAEIAAASDIVVSMVAGDASLEEVALGPDGVLANARPGAIYVDMSTVSPMASGKVAAAAAEKGVAYVSAPVSGSTLFAARAELIVLASGPKDACDACMPAFEAMSRKIVYMGGGGEARFIKLVLNMMVGVTAAMVGEALTFGEAGGLDWDGTIDVVADSPVASPLIGFKARMLKDRNFAPAFSAAQMAKDFDLILATAKEQNLPMPVTELVRRFWGSMMETGRGDLDMFACVSLMEEMAGIEPAE